jgi:hypothetical protein
MTVRRLLLPVIVGCAVIAFPAPASATPPSKSLVGEWQRVIHCQDLVRALTAAGFEAEETCKGAAPVRHSHFFTSDGLFGSLDENGNQVDEGTYEIIDERTFVIPYGFEEGPPILVTFHYRIHGNTIVFDPVIPSDCSTDRCREAAAWSITVALEGRTWRRVG